MDKDIQLAIEARKFARSPYNKYEVGALLRTKSGKTYTGCNIDNYGIQCSCAERTAFLKALSEGETEFESISIVGGYMGSEPTDTTMPCGYCRTFMSEYVDKDFKIRVLDKDGSVKEFTLDELLPYSYEF